MTHASALPDPPRKWLARLVGPASDPVRLLSLFEQGLISGANFLALLVLARDFSVEDFGLYSFAYICLQFLVNLHRSIVVVPFVIHTAQTDGLGREGRRWRELNTVAVALSLAGLAIAALLVAPFGGPGWMRQAFLATLVFIGPNYYYEFYRRWAIQLGRYALAVAGAGLYTGITLGGFFLATRLHSLAAAVAAYAAANLAAAALFLPVVRRTADHASGRGGKAFFVRLRGFLTWSLLSNLAYNGYFHLPALILGSMVGPVPVAAYQALRNFTQPLNIVGTAVDNFDKPRAARALAEAGVGGLRRQLLRTTLAMATVSLPYMAAVACLARPALALVYAHRYAGFEDILYLWIVTSGLTLAAYPVETGLMLLRRPDLLFRGRLLAAVAAAAICYAAVPAWGVAGAMIGLQSGVLGSLLFGILYLRKAIRHWRPA